MIENSLVIPESVIKDISSMREQLEQEGIALQGESHSREPLQMKGALRIQPIWLKDLSAENSSVKWLLDGMLAIGQITLLSGAPKCGKTTLINYFLSSTDSFLGLERQKFKTLIVTEESQDLWFTRKELSDLPGDEIAILPRLFLVKPKSQEWVNCLKEIANICEREKIELVIFDTVSQVWPVKDENDAAQVTEALKALHQLTEKEIAVLLIHHNRKSGGNDGEGARGSNSLMGFIDIGLDFTRDAADRKRRKLKSTSRFGETPEELVIELTENGYVALGTVETEKWIDKKSLLLSLMPLAPDGIALKELHEKFETAKSKPNPTTVWRWVQRAEKEGLIRNVGKSTKRGNPVLYGRVPTTDYISNTETDKILGKPNTKSEGFMAYVEGGY